jgi:hypothetical protein
MLRILFNVATVLSLVLCAVTVALWVRSYGSSHLVICRTNAGSYSFISERGEGCARWIETIQRTPLEHAKWSTYRAVVIDGTHYVPPQSTERRMGGFWIEQGRMPHPYPGEPAYAYAALVIPYWSLVVVLMALPLSIAVRIVRRWRNRNRGLCPSCNYDLRATPARCPECGRMPAR